MLLGIYDLLQYCVSNVVLSIMSATELTLCNTIHACRDRLVLDPTEHPMLLAEPTFNTKAFREQMVQAMFEDYGCPAVFLAKNAVLSSFATGRQTSLVLDAGHEGTVGEHHKLLLWNAEQLSQTFMAHIRQVSNLAYEHQAYIP